MTEPICSGPSTDARDCPVHKADLNREKSNANDREALLRVHEWLTNIGDGAPDASKTQRMALGYADDIAAVLDGSFSVADERLFTALLAFTETRGRHEGEHEFTISACHKCETSYVAAEDALAESVKAWIDAKGLEKLQRVNYAP